MTSVSRHSSPPPSFVTSRLSPWPDRSQSPAHTHSLECGARGRVGSRGARTPWSADIFVAPRNQVSMETLVRPWSAQDTKAFLGGACSPHPPQRPSPLQSRTHQFAGTPGSFGYQSAATGMAQFNGRGCAFGSVRAPSLPSSASGRNRLEAQRPFPSVLVADTSPSVPPVTTRVVEGLATSAGVERFAETAVDCNPSNWMYPQAVQPCSQWERPPQTPDKQSQSEVHRRAVAAAWSASWNSSAYIGAGVLLNMSSADKDTPPKLDWARRPTSVKRTDNRAFGKENQPPVVDVKPAPHASSLHRESKLTVARGANAGFRQRQIEQHTATERLCLDHLSVQDLVHAPVLDELEEFSAASLRFGSSAANMSFEGVSSYIRRALNFLRSIPYLPCTNAGSVCPFLPLRAPGAPRVTLVLDLDETLVHCSRGSKAPKTTLSTPAARPDIIVDFDDTPNPARGDVAFRPFAIPFLQAVAQSFEVVIFTASQKCYADQVIDALDPDGTLIAHRLYRQHCTELHGAFFKELSLLGRPLTQCILVDNSPISAVCNADNSILVKSWYDDPADEELMDLIHVLEVNLASGPDVSRQLIDRYGLHDFFATLRADGLSTPQREIP